MKCRMLWQIVVSVSDNSRINKSQSNTVSCVDWLFPWSLLALVRDVSDDAFRVIQNQFNACRVRIA